MQSKSDLVSRCHELVDAVKEQERELAAEVRSVYKDAEQVIETEKKAFRSGYEDRLQKFLTSKASEYKESTAKALHPEISRLQMLHEQELSSAQLHIQSQERAIQETMASKLEARLEEERAAAKEELKLSARALQDKMAAEIENTKREQRRQLQRLADDLERDLEKHRLFLKDKAQRGRDRVHAEMQQLQQSSQARIADLQQRHLKHIETLQDEHEREMESLRRQAESNRKAHQSDMRRQLQRGADKFTDSDLDEGAQGYSSAGKGSSSSRNNKGSSGSHSPSKAIRSGGKKSTGGASSLRLHDLASFSDEDEDRREAISARDIESTAEEEVEVAAVVRAAEEERNKQLQAEIRALESETLRLERQWRARAEAEEKSVLSAVAVEEEHSQVRRQRLLRGSNNTGSSRTGGEEDAAELVVKREQLIQQLQALRVEHERTAQEEKELTDEIQVYRDGVAAHKERVHDKQEQHRLRLRELQLEFGPKLRELKEQIDVLTTQQRDETERCRRQAAATDKEHATELAKLDEQVKTEMGRREDEIENLKEAVEAEEAKIVRLERLIKQYNSSLDGSSSSTGAAGTSSAAAGHKTTTRPAFSTTGTSNSHSGGGGGGVRSSNTGRRSENGIPSSDRSTASSYISADSTAVGSGSSSRVSAPRSRLNATVGAAPTTSSSSRPATRPMSGGLTTKTATASAVSEGLQHLRLHRTTAGRVNNTVSKEETKSDSDVDLEIDDDIEVDKSLNYDLSDDEEPLPTPAWMKPVKY
eukprot:CAMPEP_0184980290 /NCGR_PEP_ID=MMETSP1098-20130426/10282_1 /TAXON_ID=89044 /ORGANISM="Spumella elongata, Strain CCAP 955/1" /LENGTH=760 /DNA_ID=CAMNT_0027503695 /DNA_START=79 /DNA_END=2361 /DNA_ORIENTATION=+